MLTFFVAQHWDNPFVRLMDFNEKHLDSILRRFISEIRERKVKIITVRCLYNFEMLFLENLSPFLFRRTHSERSFLSSVKRISFGFVGRWCFWYHISKHLIKSPLVYPFSISVSISRFLWSSSLSYSNVRLLLVISLYFHFTVCLETLSHSVYRG